MLNAIEALPEIMNFSTGQFGALHAIVSEPKKGTWDPPLIGAHGNQAFNILQYPSISFNIDDLGGFL